MAKKIVKVNEEKIRGYMVGDIPDAKSGKTRRAA